MHDKIVDTYVNMINPDKFIVDIDNTLLRTNQAADDNRRKFRCKIDSSKRFSLIRNIPNDMFQEDLKLLFRLALKYPNQSVIEFLKQYKRPVIIVTAREPYKRQELFGTLQNYLHPVPVENLFFNVSTGQRKSGKYNILIDDMFSPHTKLILVNMPWNVKYHWKYRINQAEEA